MRDVKLSIPLPAKEFLRSIIEEAGGREVYFLGRVVWDERQDLATLQEVDVVARGNRLSVAAIVERAEEWDLAIHNHPSGDLTPSNADIDVASELGNRSVGFAIVSNDAERHNLVVVPFRREHSRPVDEAEILQLFGSEGPLARGLEGFERRDGQLEMALEVARALNDNRVIACEAGTGVGKSFAYLLPSILWAVRNRRRVVVSTGTIALQEQLVSKDLPFLEKVLPLRFRYALIKGRNNYACRRKLSELPREFEIAPLHPEEQEQLKGLIAWVETTGDGSLADLPVTPPRALWEKAMSETDKSLKVACPHFQECFYYAARRRAAGSQIVVANHHLFFADLSARRATGNHEFDLILPGYSRVVFDEAHHLEDVASEHLGVRFSRLGVRQRLGRMSSKEGRRGDLVVLAKKLRHHGDEVAAKALERTYTSVLPEIAAAIDERFAQIETRLEEERLSGREEAPSPLEAAIRVRYKSGGDLESFWAQVEEQLASIRCELERVTRLNDNAVESLKRARVPEETLPSLLLDLTSFGGRLEGLIGSIIQFCDFDDFSQARWIERGELRRRGERSSVSFAASPIRIAEVLVESLYECLKSVVLTSATLSVGGKPTFLGDRLGFTQLGEERFLYRSFPSPFNFRDQVRLVVPDDLPPPTTRGFASRLPELILEILRASRGRAFVLFTSYALLRRTYDQLKERIAGLGWRPLAQGDAQRSVLLERFRAGSCVLFGTDSFWEGVDVKGEALSCVILTRLPFRVPTEPLQEARLEEVEARGANAFTEFTVPQAVLRFKQGFGRLIRSTTDRGVVAVLDARVLSRPYGKVFLASLPPAGFLSAPSAAVIGEVRRFFSDGGGTSGSGQEKLLASPVPQTPAARAGEAMDPPWEVPAREPHPEPDVRLREINAGKSADKPPDVPRRDPPW